MTNQKRFRQYLTSKGFAISPALAVKPIRAHYYKDARGNHILLDEICCSMFTGVNTKEGDLGCLCFYYHGSRRFKHCRIIDESAEILKYVLVCSSAYDAIQVFESWLGNSAQTLATWTQIM